jgi:hypothetical protein
MHFKVRGSGDNLVLERYGENGEATSARPASQEEWLMYRRLVRVEREVQAALYFADELAKEQQSARPARLDSLMNEAAMIAIPAMDSLKVE